MSSGSPALVPSPMKSTSSAKQTLDPSIKSNKTKSAQWINQHVQNPENAIEWNKKILMCSIIEYQGYGRETASIFSWSTNATKAWHDKKNSSDTDKQVYEPVRQNPKCISNNNDKNNKSIHNNSCIWRFKLIMGQHLSKQHS